MFRSTSSLPLHAVVRRRAPAASRAGADRQAIRTDVFAAKHGSLILIDPCLVRTGLPESIEVPVDATLGVHNHDISPLAKQDCIAMVSKYFGKRKLVGQILTERVAEKGLALVDLVGLDRRNAVDFAEAATKTPGIRGTAILTVHEMASEGGAMTKYYDELEEVVRKRCREDGIPTCTYSASAIVEELALYLSHPGEVFGSYLEDPMLWVTASEVADAVCSTEDLGVTDCRKILATSRRTVERVLNGLAVKSGGKYHYQHLAPNILAEVYRQKRIGEDDSQIVDQLPYYQYYISQLA